MGSKEKGEVRDEGCGGRRKQKRETNREWIK